MYVTSRRRLGNEEVKGRREIRCPNELSDMGVDDLGGDTDGSREALKTKFVHGHRLQRLDRQLDEVR